MPTLPCGFLSQIAMQRMHGAYIGSHSKIPLVVEYSIVSLPRLRQHPLQH